MGYLGSEGIEALLLTSDVCASLLLRFADVRDGQREQGNEMSEVQVASHTPLRVLPMLKNKSVHTKRTRTASEMQSACQKK